MGPRAATELTSTSGSLDRGRRLVHRRVVETVTWGCSVAICFFLSTRTALAHEKWFHEGPWAPANWRNLAQFPTAALIAGVVVITIVAALVRRRLARPNVFPGPVALGADPDGITRFYALVPVILAIHVAVPLLVYGIQGHLFVPYLNLHGVWQYWLGLIQVGAAVALFYGGLTRLAAIAIGVAWLTGIGVFGLEPMLENSHYVGFAAFFFLAGRGPFSIDHLLFPRWDPPSHMMRLAPSALRIGVGISLVMVAFTEKLANPQLALSFSAATSTELHRSVGYADVRCHIRAVCWLRRTTRRLVRPVRTIPSLDYSRRLVTVQSDTDDLRLGGTDRSSAVLWRNGVPAGLDTRGARLVDQGNEG